MSSLEHSPQSDQTGRPPRKHRRSQLAAVAALIAAFFVFWLAVSMIANDPVGLVFAFLAVFGLVWCIWYFLIRRGLKRLLVLPLALLALIALFTYGYDQKFQLGVVVVALVVFGLAAMTLLGVNWLLIVRHGGAPAPWRRGLYWFFVGQLGKYVPGAIWPMVAQMELGRRLGLPRRRSAAAFVLTMLVVFTSALFVASGALPLLGRDGTAGYRWLLVLTPLIAGLLHPRVLNRLLGLFFRLLRREPLERPLSGRGVIRAFGWALVAWAWFGLHIAVLMTELDVPVSRALPLALGAFAIAWCAGPVVMIAPAGAGVRELALVALLAPVLGPAGALVVALASRLFLTVADLLLAGLAALAATRRPAAAG